MLTILFKILGILGIVLLVLLGIAVVVILLVLFFPICYKVSGKKDAEGLRLTAKARWLFGFLRLNYDHPDPGKLLIRLLFFTLYDSSAEKPQKEVATTGKSSQTDPVAAPTNPTSQKPGGESATTGAEAENATSSEKTNEAVSASAFETKEPEIKDPREESSGEKTNRWYGFFEKVRYTFRKICAKIKNILQNIAFYKELWNAPDTQELLKHAGKCLGHIFKRLRPRKLTVTATVGTGSPDTTGYLYGIYGMLLPKLGKGICITPDFEQAVLEGDFKASGHFTVACVLFQSLRLLLDRKLRQLLHKIRQYQKTQK